MILSKYKYDNADKEKYKNREIDKDLMDKLEQIRAETYRQLPFDNLDINDSTIYNLYYQRTDWWLKNFKLEQ